MNQTKFFIAFIFLLASAVGVSAQSIQFPKGFSLIGYGSGNCPDRDEGCSWSESKIYQDSYGLIYSVSKKTSPNKCKKEN
jgi:hypothetical protein